MTTTTTDRCFLCGKKFPYCGCMKRKDERPACGTYKNYDTRTPREKWDWYLKNERANDPLPKRIRWPVMEKIIREIMLKEQEDSPVAFKTGAPGGSV